MTLDNHTLLNDFPDHHHTIRHLKMNDNHFAKLFVEYHDLTETIRQAEDGSTAIADNTLTEMKSERINLKDKLYSAIVAEEAKH